MFATVILTIAIVAMLQFALYYWRAVISGVAALPVSGQVFEAAHVAEPELVGDDFERLAGLYALTPELKKGGSGLGLVAAYYQVVHRAGQFLGSLSPAIKNWTERERVLCARFAAVQIDRRLQSNLAQVASIRSC
jgi:hypothetical protein